MKVNHDGDNHREAALPKPKSRLGYGVTGVGVGTNHSGLQSGRGSESWPQQGSGKNKRPGKVDGGGVHRTEFHENPEVGGEFSTKRRFNVYTKPGAKTYREDDDLGQFPQSRYRSRNP